MARDWLKPYGIQADVSEYSSGGDMTQVFVAGNLDIADGGSGRLVTLAILGDALESLLLGKLESMTTRRWGVQVER